MLLPWYCLQAQNHEANQSTETDTKIRGRTKTVPGDGTNAFIILIHVLRGLSGEKKAECRGKYGASNAEHEHDIIDGQIPAINL